MQKDTEVGRIAMAVPVIISCALEMFLKCWLTKTCLITQAKFSHIVSVAHMTKKNNISVEMPSGAGNIAPRRNLGTLENDSSSSESELYICL